MTSATATAPTVTSDDARRDAMGKAWRDDREESPPAGHQHVARDMEADVTDQTPGHATVERSDGRLRHDRSIPHT